MSQLIMVIDDEAGMRDLICDALKLAGFETIEAPDAMVAQVMTAPFIVAVVPARPQVRFIALRETAAPPPAAPVVAR